MGLGGGLLPLGFPGLGERGEGSHGVACTEEGEAEVRDLSLGKVPKESVMWLLAHGSFREGKTI